ncbi:MAG: PEGA domain-containing protein, partial [Acidobacteria bacterium]|nr:PEGA domain-containing protein [Acidobacteriota bacterium]
LGRTGGERIRLAEGRHQIELVNGDTGYRAVRVVHVVGGKVTNLAMPTPANGVVNVNASPWAEVWIDGRRVGETPLANVSVPLGSHEVVFRHPEFGEKRQTISVTGGAPVRISVDMK